MGGGLSAAVAKLTKALGVSADELCPSQTTGELARRPDRYADCCLQEVSIAADDRVDFRRFGEYNEIVIGWIARDCVLYVGISVNRGVPLDACHKLSSGRLVEPAAELRAQDHATQLRDQLRTGDNVDPLIDPCLYNQVWWRARASNES